MATIINNPSRKPKAEGKNKSTMMKKEITEVKTMRFIYDFLKEPMHIQAIMEDTTLEKYAMKKLTNKIKEWQEENPEVQPTRVQLWFDGVYEKEFWWECGTLIERD